MSTTSPSSSSPLSTSSAPDVTVSSTSNASTSTTFPTSSGFPHPPPPPPPPPPPNNDQATLRNSSSLLFGFLVTFLALFVVFMVFGLGWRHWMDRRRRRRTNALDEMRERRMREAIPKIWDVWVAPGDSEWRRIMPLSAGVAPTQSSSSDPSTSQRQLESQAPARPGSFVSRTFAHLGGRISIPHPMPEFAEGNLDEKKREQENIAQINDNGLEVAVVIAMPVPAPASTGEQRPGPSTADRDGTSIQDNPDLKEYALGVTQVHLKRPMDGL